MKYSVLMSVYAREKPEYLRESMMSILTQTVPTDDFVLVCDGPLDDGLNACIAEMRDKFGGTLSVVRLETNVGLGGALNIGLAHCRHELVGRMDSDDISFRHRFERQLAVMRQNPELSILSGTVLEFRGDASRVIGRRELPETDREIRRYARRRCPFNHPAVMFRKSVIERAGGYRTRGLRFEDYDLWNRVLSAGGRGYNIPEPVLFMRTSEDFYVRRGGLAYAREVLRFRWEMYARGWSGPWDFLAGAVLQTAVCLSPNWVRKAVYRRLHAAEDRIG